jgi:hypothetical protein
MNFPDCPDLLSDALHELIGVAVCDREFRDLLLRDPRKAADQFGLHGRDRQVAVSIKAANSLADYAVKLERRFAGVKAAERVTVRQRNKSEFTPHKRSRKAS